MQERKFGRKLGICIEMGIDQVNHKQMKNEKLKNIIKWANGELCGDFVASKTAHGDRSAVYKLSWSDKVYFLKVGNSLTGEYERLVWLEDRLPVPKVIAFDNIQNCDALLLTEIKGKNLKVLCKQWPAEKVVSNLVQALQAFHNIDTKDCPFGTAKKGDVLIHGDASLPNFLFEGAEFSGYVDLGDMTIGNKETDFAAAIWSLQYNLGKGYGKMFLEKYGVTGVTDEMVENLRLKYEDMQEAWGL